MLKCCANCNGIYYARWRNEPTPWCPTCRADVVLCAVCNAVITPARDANQLLLWPYMLPATGARLRTIEEREPHFSHGVRATNLQRQKNPYQ